MTRCGAPTSSGRPCRRAAGPTGRCPQHDTPATLAAWVDRALEGVPEDWRTTLARRLAAELDGGINAALVRELRAVMADVAEASATPRADVADELRARRAARQARAAGR